MALTCMVVCVVLTDSNCLVLVVELVLLTASTCFIHCVNTSRFDR